MNKLMTVVAASVCAVSLSAVAAEDPKENQASAEALEEEETPIFEAGADLDFFSAYVWRNAVQNDEPVVQPCVWADLTYFEPFWLGFSIWQNYDLTDRRGNIYKYGLNETDYNVHGGVTVWSSDDDEMSVDLEIGHDWYTYYGVRDGLKDEYPNTSEVYVKATFNNPLVNVFGQASYMYGDYGDYRQSMHYELGFNKEVELCDSLTLGADWNVNFGDARYLTFLYGGTKSGAYVHEDGEEPYDDYKSASAGIGGTTVKLYLNYDITDWLQVGATIAYTGLVSGPHREALGEQGEGYQFCYDDAGSYPRDLFWGGLSLHTSF